MEIHQENFFFSQKTEKRKILQQTFKQKNKGNFQKNRKGQILQSQFWFLFDNHTPELRNHPALIISIHPNFVNSEPKTNFQNFPYPPLHRLNPLKHNLDIPRAKIGQTMVPQKIEKSRKFP